MMILIPISIFIVIAISIARSAAWETKTNVTLLDCGMRQLALEYATKLISDRQHSDPETLGLVHDALRLTDLCGLDRPPSDDQLSEDSFKLPKTVAAIASRRVRTNSAHVTKVFCPYGTICVFVGSKEGNTSNKTKFTIADGSIDCPFWNLQEALDYARTRKNTTVTATKLILRHGVHSLSQPLTLSRQDSGLSIVGYPGETVWISGGISLKEVDFLPWSQNPSILVANLSTILRGVPLPNITSLFTSQRRYTRARYPNSNPEIDQWGYASYHRLNYSLSPDLVVEWHKPPKGTPPNFTLVDFTTNPPPGIPVKNNSAQPGYNWYATGQGGVCNDVWETDTKSYWCSNASQGGWAEVDQECAMTGQLQIPVGMTYNRSTVVGHRLDRYNSSTGAILHAWHSQSWSMHMFEINHQEQGQFQFTKGGGRQGGRNWCRCDQCTYAGSWCGQHQTPPNDTDSRLISGTWIVENILDELDQPGEFYFDKGTNLLYVWPNHTLDLIDLRMALFERLLDVSHVENITIENLGFRDMAATYMNEWSAPSGGDWAIHRGGAIFVEHATQVNIQHCRFFRLDGNAIFLSRKTRNVTIQDNKFEWIGESAIATWGDSNDYDATSGDFPIYTLIQYNVMRELGIYQKQSSAVGQCKAALTTVRNNIMFNMPRAAINFNDLMGGGDIVERNLIFNTCRESGDHGPINTWDRQPFLTNLIDEAVKSFDPIPRTIRNNFIIANYGASQGVDSDDGSSWYRISQNVFYSAEGFKMDYGGHDSIFQDNLVMSYPYDGGQCFNMAGFLEGHGDTLTGNICIVGLGHKMDSGCGDPSCARPDPEDHDALEVVGRLWDGCQDSHVSLTNNRYFTPDGNASFYCGNDKISLEELQQRFGLELNSTRDVVPVETEMLAWARSMLFKHSLENTKDFLTRRHNGLQYYYRT